MSSYFGEVASDFYRYLTGPGGVSHACRTNYMSWLRFLSENYALHAQLSETDIESIISSERIARLRRSRYTQLKDIGNFRSALRKYKDFLSFGFRQKSEEINNAEENRIMSDKTLAQTERVAIVRARRGQGLFRDRLIEYWNGCSISLFAHLDVLVASHIMPWSEANNQQRVDVYNGLLLLPNYDKLFDRGYITFNDDGEVILSALLTGIDRDLLRIDQSIKLSRIEDKHREYLMYHREHCYMSM